jgi:transposase
MNKPEKFVGIDIGSETFFAAIGAMENTGWKIIVRPTEFQNTVDQLPQFVGWLNKQNLTPKNCILCMEATGVYGEALAYFLVSQNYQVVVEPPLKVKRAFKVAGHKSDPVDSCQIAEYAYRFCDQLRFWQPQEEIYEQIKALLTLREQCVVQRTAHKNANHALKRKVVRTPLAERIHEQAIEELNHHIKEIEQEIEHLINQDPPSKGLHKNIKSIPGIGSILAVHFLVSMQTAPDPYCPKNLAAYIGICPYEDSSGTSRHRLDTSRHYGPSAMRRLLYLAAMSAREHQPKFRQYFLRKVAEGKPKQLVINNIANKLLRIVCAVARTGNPYIEEYRSIHPDLLRIDLPLTVS